MEWHKSGKKGGPSSSGSSGESWEIKENQENPTNFNRFGTAGRLGPEILASKILPKDFWGNFRPVKSPKISKNVAPKASRRGRRRCWKMMKMMKYSIFPAPAASIGGAEGAPNGRHRLHWSAGGETHVARPARCLREERGRCGPYDLRY